MDRHRLEEIFFSFLKNTSPESMIQQLNFPYQAEISYLMDLSSLQDSFRFRGRYLAWKIATLLIDEKGDLQKEILSQLHSLFSQDLFLLGPGKEGDTQIYAHLLTCLEFLSKDLHVWELIRKFSVPICHKYAEEIVLETLWPTPIRVLETFHVRRAVLTSWLTLLRQTVGSCFATAPAILIQKQPRMFFKDLYELLSTGQLRRIVEGKEYAVPLCLASGKMDLEKPFLFSERLCFSPGLMSALVSVNLLSENMSLEKKIEQLRQALVSVQEEKTPELLIQKLLLNSVGLTQEDLEEEARSKKREMTPLLAREEAVYYQRPSLRAQKINDWKKRCAKAQRAFQALAECSLLRTWEYTIASFSDVKVDFARWNLYLGLGLQVNQIGGIGEFLYKKIESLLQDCNEKISSYHREYESMKGQVYALESLLHRSAGDAQRYQLRGDLSAAIHTLQTMLDIRDRHIAQAEALANFFSTLIHFYVDHLVIYFQEVFDPAVSRTAIDLYEDSPAGFRLLYKHGRSNASLWTLIHPAEDYIRSLRLFFSAVENDLVLPAPLEKSFFSEITTELIQFIQEPDFLAGAMARSQSLGRAAPWNYLSGGTMQTLVQAYVERNSPLTEVSFLPRSEMDLLHFLLELKNTIRESVLIHSPTHAFILHLDWLPTQADDLLKKTQATVAQWNWNEEQQEYLAHLLSERLPPLEKPLFLHRFRQKPLAETAAQFHNNLSESLQGIEGISPSIIDSLLYENTPLLEKSKIKEALQAILLPLSKLHSLSFPRMIQLIEKEEKSLMSSLELIQTVKGIILQLIENPLSSIDWDQEIHQIARNLNLCYPHPLLFADTNWSGWFFGFVFNISTHRLELWRLNRTGSQGSPMSEWKIWFSEENKVPWVVLSHPKEYKK